jgi:hypothetical protein
MSPQRIGITISRVSFFRSGSSNRMDRSSVWRLRA